MTLPYWRLSSFYFFYYATLGCFLPYWGLYLQETGFSASEIGELFALMMATKIIAPNISGWIADHSGKSLVIIRLASLLAAIIFGGFLLGKDYQWFALVTVGFSFFWNAALPQFEAATLAHLRQEPRRYSQIRLWGSVGFILSVYGLGSYLQAFDLQSLPWIILAMLTGIWLTTMLTPEAKAGVSLHDTGGVWRILKKPEVIAFFFVYMLLQLAHGPYYVFYTIYMKQAGYSATLIGFLWALGVCAEIVLFVFMNRLLGKVSLRAILLISICFSILRWQIIACFSYSLAMMLGAQILHAASFGSSHVAAIHLVHHYFGTRHQGKGQALYSSTSFGLGGMLGSLYSGYYWDAFGATFVYAMAAATCCVALIFALIWVGREKPTLLS